MKQIVLDFEILRSRGILTPEDGRSTGAEEFRIIKRPLLMNATGQGPRPVHNGKMIMVTSALPKEGKTYTAINLAMSLANEVDNNVLLVDGDVAKPSVSRILGFKASVGLIDYLLEDVKDLDDVILQTNINKLSLIPSGRRYRHSTELLASDSMRVLIKLLSESDPDRIVVFDSPPLLVTTEARELARNMGQIVMVVESEKTPVFAARDALGQLDNHDIVGLVLNKAKPRGRSGYYYSYGGYGGYYGGYGGSYGGYGGYSDYGGYGDYGDYGDYGEYSNYSGYSKGTNRKKSFWKRLLRL